MKKRNQGKKQRHSKTPPKKPDRLLRELLDEVEHDFHSRRKHQLKKKARQKSKASNRRSRWLEVNRLLASWARERSLLKGKLADKYGISFADLASLIYKGTNDIPLEVLEYDFPDYVKAYLTTSGHIAKAAPPPKIMYWELVQTIMNDEGLRYNQGIRLICKFASVATGELITGTFPDDIKDYATDQLTAGSGPVSEATHRTIAHEISHLRSEIKALRASIRFITGKGSGRQKDDIRAFIATLNQRVDELQTQLTPAQPDSKLFGPRNLVDWWYHGNGGSIPNYLAELRLNEKLHKAQGTAYYPYFQLTWQNDDASLVEYVLDEFREDEAEVIRKRKAEIDTSRKGSGPRALGDSIYPTDTPDDIRDLEQPEPGQKTTDTGQSPADQKLQQDLADIEKQRLELERQKLELQKERQQIERDRQQLNASDTDKKRNHELELEKLRLQIELAKAQTESAKSERLKLVADLLKQGLSFDQIQKLLE